MNKKTGGKSGFFNPRIITAFILVMIGISMGVFSFAAPTSPSRSQKFDNGPVQPTVINSTFNGVSKAMRDLPKVNPLNVPAEAEHDLLRVKPTQPVPSGFVDQAVQSAAPAVATIPAPNGTFEGQSSVDAAGGSPAGSLSTPPDPNGAIGPTQYVQMVNSIVSVYDRAGTRLSGPAQINSFFSTLPATSLCSADNNGDPIVVYDQLADRWLISQFAVTAVSGDNPPSSECIAISKSGDATGEWYIYDFQLTGGNFEDYPHIGLWPDAYYMSTHEFSFASGNPFLGAGAWAFERAQMLAGLPARVVYFRLGAGDPVASQTFFGGQEPSNLDGFTLPPAGSPNYFVEVDATGDGARPDGVPAGPIMDIWKFHVDWSNPANSTFGDSLNNPNTRTPVADFARASCSETVTGGGCVPQLGDPGTLDSIGDRLMYRVAYRNFGGHESLVLNHTVVSNAVNGQAIQFGPRWYEVRGPGGTPTIFQQSTLGPLSMTDLLYRWMSSVAMDSAGNMAIGYSTSSNANFPSIAYSGRLATDSPNTMAQGEAQLFAGTGPQHNELFIPFSQTRFGRWGDYSAMQIDPVDDCTFWYTNMYYSATDAPAGIWHTRVGSFKFPQCTPRPTGFLQGTVTDSTTGNPIVGASVTAGGYTALTNKTGFYQFSPLAPGSYSDTASWPGYFPSTATGVTVTNGGVTVQNFALARNQAQPTPTPPPPTVVDIVNPPVLTAPSGTTTNNFYTVTWNPAEVTTNLASYVVEESTNYVQPLFDNADTTPTPPSTVGPLWNTDDDTGDTTGWIVSPLYHNSAPNSYEGPGIAAAFAFDPRLTLKNAITIPASVGSGRLTYYSRYYNGPANTGNTEISTDNGATWTSLKILTAQSPGPANTRMQSYEIDLTAYKGNPFLLRLRFDSGPTFSPLVPSVGWWVDDINVDGATWAQIGTTAGSTTSLNITSKPGGHYFYRVRGNYMDGNFTDHSNVLGITVNLPLSLTNVVSEKTHGSAGNFDVNLPLTGTRGVECRAPGGLPNGATGDYQLIFTFSNNLQSVGSATVSHARNTTTASVGSTAKGPKPNQYTVNLTNVSNAQYLQVNLFNVTDTLGNTATAVSSPEMGVLIGDVNANGLVDGNDVSAVQGQTRQSVSDTNFREDVNANGIIDGNDVSLTQGQTRTSLPTFP